MAEIDDVKWRLQIPLHDKIFNCPKCFGNGFIPEPYYINPELDEYSEIDYDCLECKHCPGTGKRFWFFHKKLP